MLFSRERYAIPVCYDAVLIVKGGFVNAASVDYVAATSHENARRVTIIASPRQRTSARISRRCSSEWSRRSSVGCVRTVGRSISTNRHAIFGKELKNSKKGRGGGREKRKSTCNTLFYSRSTFSNFLLSSSLPSLLCPPCTPPHTLQSADGLCRRLLDA